MGSVALLQRPQGSHKQGRYRAGPPTRHTIELQQTITIILGQAVLSRIAHWALVEGPHDGVGCRGVAQAQGMAELMNGHRKQVDSLTIWGRGTVDSC